MGGHSGGSFAKSDECLQFLEQQVEAKVGRERCNGRKQWAFCYWIVLDGIGIGTLLDLCPGCRNAL